MFKLSTNNGVTELVIRADNETLSLTLFWANIALAGAYMGFGWVMFGLASAYFVTTIQWCKWVQNKRKTWLKSKKHALYARFIILKESIKKKRKQLGAKRKRQGQIQRRQDQSGVETEEPQTEGGNDSHQEGADTQATE